MFVCSAWSDMLEMGTSCKIVVPVEHQLLSSRIAEPKSYWTRVAFEASSNFGAAGSRNRTLAGDAGNPKKAIHVNVDSPRVQGKVSPMVAVGAGCLQSLVGRTVAAVRGHVRDGTQAQQRQARPRGRRLTSVIRSAGSCESSRA